MTPAREEIEAVAKLCGLLPTQNCLGNLAFTTGNGSGCFEWAPWEFNDHALELAVKIGMEYGLLLSLAASGPVAQVGSKPEAWEKWNADPLAATRTAIWRAAVAMTKENERAE